MSCREVVCLSCARNCIQIHTKRKRSNRPFVSSFCKIIAGNSIGKTLQIPQNFVPTVSTLIGEETFLEDSSGVLWKVKLSNVNNSVAIDEGWNAFASHHCLTFGNIIVFHYVIGLHFVVQIYDKSGCEKLGIPEKKNQKRKIETDRIGTFKNVPCHTIDKGSIQKKTAKATIFSGSNVVTSQVHNKVDNNREVEMAMADTSRIKITSVRPQAVSKFELAQDSCCVLNRELVVKQNKVDNKRNVEKIMVGTSRNNITSDRPQAESKAEFSEDPCLILHRELGGQQSEPRRSIDFMNLEIPMKNLGSNGNAEIIGASEKSPHATHLSLSSQNEAVLADKESLGKGVVNSGDSNSEMLENADDYNRRNNLVTSNRNSNENNVSGHLSTTFKRKPEKDSVSSSNLSVEVLKKCKVLKGKDKAESRKKSTKIKPEHSSKSPIEANKNVVKSQEVKPESFDVSNFPSANAVKISCVATVQSKGFLEVPKTLSQISGRKMSKEGRMKFVLLRDPSRRPWPVLYHEICGLKYLGSGWQAFAEASNIHCGDECIFQVEDSTEGIFDVRIIHK